MLYDLLNCAVNEEAKPLIVFSRTIAEVVPAFKRLVPIIRGRVKPPSLIIPLALVKFALRMRTALMSLVYNPSKVNI
ncbi:hypothetical protein D3C85_954860 [compost metagenome]